MSASIPNSDVFDIGTRCALHLKSQRRDRLWPRRVADTDDFPALARQSRSAIHDCLQRRGERLTAIAVDRALFRARAGGAGTESMNSKRAWWHWFSTSLGVNTAIVLFNAILIGIMWNAVFGLVRTERQDTIRAAIDRNDNLAIAFEQYTVRTLQSADAVIQYLVREYVGSGRDDGPRQIHGGATPSTIMQLSVSFWLTNAAMR